MRLLNQDTQRMLAKFGNEHTARAYFSKSLSITNSSGLRRLERICGKSGVGPYLASGC